MFRKKFRDRLHQLLLKFFCKNYFTTRDVSRRTPTFILDKLLLLNNMINYYNYRLY